MTIKEKLLKAIKRGKRYKKMYKDIGRNGIFGLTFINEKLEIAEKALKSNESQYMKDSIEALNSIE